MDAEREFDLKLDGREQTRAPYTYHVWDENDDVVNFDSEDDARAAAFKAARAFGHPVPITVKQEDRYCDTIVINPTAKVA